MAILIVLQHRTRPALGVWKIQKQLINQKNVSVKSNYKQVYQDAKCSPTNNYLPKQTHVIFTKPILTSSVAYDEPYKSTEPLRMMFQWNRQNKTAAWNPRETF